MSSIKDLYLLTPDEYWKQRVGTSYKDSFGRTTTLGQYSSDRERNDRIHHASVMFALRAGKKIPTRVIKALGEEYAYLKEQAEEYLEQDAALRKLKPGDPIIVWDEKAEFRKLDKDGGAVLVKIRGKNRRVARSTVKI